MLSKEKEIMIVQDGCGHCEDAIEKLQPFIKNGQVEAVNAFSPRGQAYCDKYDVDATPTILSGKGDDLKKCLLSEDGKKIFCEDGSEKVL